MQQEILKSQKRKSSKFGELNSLQCEVNTPIHPWWKNTVTVNDNPGLCLTFEERCVSALCVEGKNTPAQP